MAEAGASAAATDDTQDGAPNMAEGQRATLTNHISRAAGTTGNSGALNQPFGAATGGRQWTANNFNSSSNSTNASRQQQPIAPAHNATRYSRSTSVIATAGSGGGGAKTRPPMRRSQSSMLNGVGTTTGGRYGMQTANGAAQMGQQLQMGRAGYAGNYQFQQQPLRSPPHRTVPPRQDSSASMFSRGATLPTQRFIAMSDADAIIENQDDDDVFAASSWNADSSTLQIYAKQLQHPRSGIPSKEKTIKGTKAMLFNGSDASEWFMLSADGVYTADQAQTLGQKLVDLGLIAAVDEKHPEFKVSASAWFYFCHPSNFTKQEAESPDRQPPKGNNDTRDKAKSSKTCVIL